MRFGLLFGALLGSLACRSAPELDVEAERAKALALTETFKAELQGQLLAAIEAGGPVAGVEVCKREAANIAARASREGWTLGRTAARVRNPDNAPNEWQARGLAELERAAASTTSPEALAQLEWHELVRDDAGLRFRYMRAIPMGGLCLGCHGPRSGLDPALVDALAEHYPDDQATDFAVGQLRGAFVVEKSY